jgi:hypothetical protein
MKRDIHPAPAERDHVGRYGLAHGFPTGESMSRDQTIKPESLDALNVTLSRQDGERVLAGDPDPELRERIEREIESVCERLYENREWG